MTYESLLVSLLPADAHSLPLNSKPSVPCLRTVMSTQFSAFQQDHQVDTAEADAAAVVSAGLQSPHLQCERTTFYHSADQNPLDDGYR